MLFSFFSNLLRWANLLLIIATLLAYCAPNIAPSSSRYFIFIGMAFPFLLLFHLFFISYWAIKRKRFFIYSLLCLLIGWSHVKGVLGLHLGSSDDPKALKVMTFNSANLILNSSKPKDQSAAFALFLKKYNPDVLCFQEFVTQCNEPYLQRYFPYQENTGGVNKRITIFSKYPIEYCEDLPYYNYETNGSTLADINVRGKKIRIYAVHLITNGVTETAGRVVNQLETGDFDKKQSKSDFRLISRHVTKGAKAREKQSANIALHAQKSPYPTIICGDFNDPPLSYSYQTLAEGRLDAFKEAGFGFSSTYLGGIPLLCIDHILVSEAFEVLDCVVPNVEFSDHYPVMATLRWK
jgi:endonuclease/exonuclease/phosphatase family metal-dependent hydrolase